MLWFSAFVKVLQSELLVYLEFSTAGNARLFAVRDTECSAVPVSAVKGYFQAAYCINVP